MSVAISLFDLLNLSIGTPEVGAVNFNALHTLLHAILDHLKIQDVTAEWRGEYEDQERHGPAEVQPYPRGKSSPYHQMEDKLRQIESQMAALEKLPSGPDLLARGTCGTSPVSDMWQQMQLRRKVEANEDGVTKSMALIQDSLKEIAGLQESRNSLQDEIRTLKEQQSLLNVNELMENIEALEKCCHQVESLEKVSSELQEKVGLYPELEELSQLIGWDVLQDILVCERLQQDHQGPRSPICVPGAGDTLTSLCGGGFPHLSVSEGWLPSRVKSIAERYPETVEALRHIGKLKQRHDSLEERVAQVEMGKADQFQLQNLREHLTETVNQNVPDNLLDQLNQLKAVVDSLVTDRIKHTEVMGDMQGTVLQLQAECEKLSNAASHLVEDHDRKQEHIDNLYKSLDQLAERKADKDHVEMEIDIKADKRALETKVSREQFAAATEQLGAMFQDLLGKVSGQEQDWHDILEKVSAEMEQKLNRIELDPLKRQLEDRWKAIRKQLQAQPAPESDDAAGIRRQLVARFHCISCDRPLDIPTPRPHLVTVPSAPGLPYHKSNRPHTVYKLEQVRQQCRSERCPEAVDHSYLPVPRSCGGSHTLTYPSLRQSRLQHAVQQLWSGATLTVQTEEVDLLGLDGHIYKGRLDARQATGLEPKLPSIGLKEGSRKSKDRATRWQMSQRASHAESRPDVPGGPLVGGIQHSHPASAYSFQERPMSSLGCLSQTTAPQSSSPL